MMRNRKVWGVLGLLLALVVVVGYGQIPVQPIQPPGDPIIQANQQLRTQVSSAMLAAARAAMISIMPGNFVFASRDDVILVNAGVAGLERISDAELARGANLGLVYLGKISPAGPIPLTVRIPAGFYTVRAFVTPVLHPGAPTAARAQLIDMRGTVVSEVPASVTVGGPALLLAWPKVTGSIGENYVEVDFHWGRIKIRIRIEW